MKVKLLKKIRKRFTYYWNSKGFPVLVDHYKQQTTVFDVDYCKEIHKYSDEDVATKLEIPVEEWAMRHMKSYVGKYYGKNFMDHLRYRTSVKRSRIKNWKLENAKAT